MFLIAIYLQKNQIKVYLFEFNLIQIIAFYQQQIICFRHQEKEYFQLDPKEWFSHIQLNLFLVDRYFSLFITSFCYKSTEAFAVFSNNARLIGHYFHPQFLYSYVNISLANNQGIYIHLYFVFIIPSIINLFDRNFKLLILLVYFVSLAALIHFHERRDYKILELQDIERFVDFQLYITFTILLPFFSKY